jgi:hypothetical protein
VAALDVRVVAIEGFTAGDVLLRRDGFEVVRVHAAGVSAEVVNL